MGLSITDEEGDDNDEGDKEENTDDDENWKNKP